MKVALTWLGRLLLGGTFAYAAVSKLLNPGAFAADIGHYRLLPYPLTLALAIYLPWLELICAGAVLVRWRERGALAVLLGLCLMFGVALASAMIRELDISCGCFGQHGSPTSLVWPLTRSLGLVVVAFALLRAAGQTIAADAKPEVSLENT